MSTSSRRRDLRGQRRRRVRRAGSWSVASRLCALPSTPASPAIAVIAPLRLVRVSCTRSWKPPALELAAAERADRRQRAQHVAHVGAGGGAAGGGREARWRSPAGPPACAVPRRSARSASGIDAAGCDRAAENGEVPAAFEEAVASVRRGDRGGRSPPSARHRGAKSACRSRSREFGRSSAPADWRCPGRRRHRRRRSWCPASPATCCSASRAEPRRCPPPWRSARSGC